MGWLKAGQLPLPSSPERTAGFTTTLAAVAGGFREMTNRSAENRVRGVFAGRLRIPAPAGSELVRHTLDVIFYYNLSSLYNTIKDCKAIGCGGSLR